MSALAWLGVAGLGGAAAITRFLVDGAISRRTVSGFPLGTLAVNLSGSLLLGLLDGLGATGETMLLLGTAAIGSYTTFSTWMFESQRLGEDGESAALAANIAVSLGAGLAAVALGRLLGGAL